MCTLQVNEVEHHRAVRFLLELGRGEREELGRNSEIVVLADETLHAVVALQELLHLVRGPVDG